ncbi:hypothetical protein D0396_12240 [Staphylococcus epidermidis]|nr:hypothetical protein CPZ17_01905 [Staphylococcus epidermidis]EFV87880.1 hypothetical protein GSEF_2304 [Staphylococcus epidermidis FRI909]ATQ58964.1 hypothetical protein CPZ21_01955 [Staphylococcus epidermidis]MBB1175279.1 hypothetical protein [Staphylococcus epidermidis]MBM0828690.1 hypothetical protein [Staphylococcus epidermidis]
MSIIILIFLLLNELEKREMLDSIESNLTLCYFKASFTENNGIVMNKALY